MPDAICHCGAVRIELDSPPVEVNDCNCSICRRRGTLWAYYSPRSVRIHSAEGGTSVYVWGDREIEFHACKVCHCTTHWSPVDTSVNRMGINARLLPPEILAAARVRHTDGASR